MAFKARVLLPAGLLAAAIVGTACVPPTNPPPTTSTTTTTLPGTTTTTTTTQPPAGCPAAGVDGTPGPNGPNAVASWGVNGTGYTALVLGDVVYVGGSFTQAVKAGQTKPHTNLAAFCVANGSLLDTFKADTNGLVRALTTDGTSIFAGGAFTNVNGQATGRLVKLDALTGAVDAGFTPPPIPDVVYALGYRAANTSVYAGGDFDIAGAGFKKGANFDATTGAKGTWNINADARIESLEISPDESKVFIGGSFEMVGGFAHNDLARTDAMTGAPDAVVFSRDNAPGGGHIDGRVFSIAVGTDNLTPYVAIGPSKVSVVPPGTSGGGNKFVAYDPASGNALWEENGPDGDAQAIELISGTLYGGFHGGWNGDPAKRLEGLNLSGNTTGFAPNTNGLKGVFGLAQGGNRLVAVGDFTSMGTTNNLHGLAIFN